MTSRVLAALAAIALLGLVGCSSSSSATGGDTPFEVKGEPVPTDKVDLPKSYKFAPAVVGVKAGTMVTWTNRDDFPHNVTLVSGPDMTSKHLGIGDSASIPFPQAGTFHYECTLHPGQMRGKVVVSG